MKQSVYFDDFRAAFNRMGREDQFSYEALKALFDYLIEYEESTGEEIELDVIALCCEYAEIDCDDSEYANYIGDDAECAEFLIAELMNSVLVVQG
jgi:hypothetical protein